MLETLAGMGAFASGIGKMSSGLSSLFGGSTAQQKYRGKYHRKQIKNEIESRMKYSRQFGEQFGFHPLLGMGINPTQGAGQVIVGGENKANRVGRGLERMGQGINNMLSAGQSEIQKAQVENLNANTNLINKKAAQIGNQSPVGQSKIIETTLPMRHPSYASGDERGRAVQALEQLYRSGNTIVAMPAEGAQDFMSESFFAMAPYAAKQIGQFMTTGRGKYPKVTIEKFRDKLDGVEAFLRSNGELRPDEYLSWNHGSGQLNVMRSKRGIPKKLFTERSRKYRQQPMRYGGMRHRRNY